MPKIHDPCVPYSVPIIHGVPHGAEIRIKGESVHGCEERFVIRLIGGEHYDDEPLHFNARFGYSGDHAIVMNSKHHDEWQCEERHHLEHHLHPGHHFDLRLKCHEDHWKVTVNHEHTYVFDHRLSPHHIHSFEIGGDVRIHSAKFKHFHHHVDKHFFGHGSDYEDSCSD
ncbi:galectin [Aphelenchoides avenae]|nr:galectin [Aphelenchus avenae]